MYIYSMMCHLIFYIIFSITFPNVRRHIIIHAIPISIKHNSALHANNAGKVVLESTPVLSREEISAQAGWFKGARARKEEESSFIVAIKHRNAQRLEDLLLSISNPQSDVYGQHFTLKKLGQLVSPLPVTIQRIKLWLERYNIRECYFSQLNEFAVCKSSVANIENIFDIELSYYNNYNNTNIENTIIRTTEDYKVDYDIYDLIDFIGGLNHFHTPINGNKKSLQHANFNSITNLNFNVTPSFLRKLYNITGTGNAFNNKQAIVEFLGEYYSLTDLVEFMREYSTNISHYSGVDKIVGVNQPSNPGLIANLDVQYIMSIGNQIPTWIWIMGGQYKNLEPFLSWIVSVSDSDDSGLPYVFSCGYSEKEAFFSKQYLIRINQEFMKLGLRGVTIVATGGDYGAGCQRSQFSPYFPASSPYVTSVGSTCYSTNNDELAIYENREEVGFTISGGGFSDVFSMPDYQKELVNNYLSSGRLPDADYFNSRGRAFPDVSAFGDQYVVRLNSEWEYRVYSTSASTVTIAGIISLLNDKRLQNGSKPFGFINPLLYQHPEAFRDIISGHNTGCFGTAFYARSGWDPVTGLGVPIFPKMSKYFT